MLQLLEKIEWLGEGKGKFQEVRKRTCEGNELLETYYFEYVHESESFKANIHKF